ncbi:MAG TPA: hypothetical protein VM889_00245 [Candidatus Thermoplasmatota archaeon]|nr:hypothetical protein [Candidatus Thermoplasmatota archaeon]
MNPAWKIAAALLLVVAAMPVGAAHGAVPDLHLAPSPRVPPLLRAPVAEDPLPFEAPSTVLPSPFAPAGYSLKTAATAGSYKLNFTCPSALLSTRVFPCPNRIIDVSDILGNPSLAIDPLFPERMAFASLHGSSGDGPTNLSRRGQQHTVHTTLTAGATWSDQPYSNPRGLGDGGNNNLHVTGEDTHIIMDSLGNMNVASLYAHRPRDSAGSDPWDYSIALWKFDSTLDRLTYAIPAAILKNRESGTTIAEPTLIELPEHKRIVLLWHESAPANKTTSILGRSLTGWVAGAITFADSISPWSMLDDKVLVGPCDDITNPIANRGKIYFGCKAGANFDLVPGVAAGDIVFVELDPVLGASRIVSKTPLKGGDPKLAMDPFGTTAIVTVEAIPGDPNVTGSDRVRAEIATSRLGEGWSAAHPFGDQIHNASLNVSIARVNAINYRTDTNTIHMIYFEQDRRESPNASRAPLYRKYLAVVDPLGTVIFNLDLDVSDKGEVFGSRKSRGNAKPYGDTRDHLLDYQGRQFFVFADYGVVVTAEILEDDQREIIQPTSTAPPVPEPVPVSTTLPVVTGAGVIAGATAAEAVRRLLAARNAAAAGSGRGK